MDSIWICINDIPEEGLHMETFKEKQSIWTVPIHTYSVEFLLLAPVNAKLSLSLQEEGCLLQGEIFASIEQPCDTCLSPVKKEIGHIFDDFIDFAEISPSDSLRVRVGKAGLIEINISDILWEEFLIDTTGKTLCSSSCFGLCTLCGEKKNALLCVCEDEENRKNNPFANILLANKN